MTVDEELDRDMMIYGTAFEYTDENGKRMRLDPTRVLIRKLETTAAEVYGRSPALDLLAAMKAAKAKL